MNDRRRRLRGLWKEVSSLACFWLRGTWDGKQTLRNLGSTNCIHSLAIYLQDYWRKYILRIASTLLPMLGKCWLIRTNFGDLTTGKRSVNRDRVLVYLATFINFSFGTSPRLLVPHSSLLLSPKPKLLLPEFLTFDVIGRRTSEREI